MRASLHATPITLTVFGVMLARWHCSTAYSQLRGTHRTQAADIAANRMTAALLEASMKRLAISSAIQAADQAGTDVLAEITRRRAAVTANFLLGLAALFKFGLPRRVGCWPGCLRRRPGRMTSGGAPTKLCDCRSTRALPRCGATSSRPSPRR